MPQATRIEDNCSGHDACPPRPLIEGSPNVFTNGRNAGRVGAQGSQTVFINGKQAGRIGDPVSCGSVVAEGSPNVYIGG